MILWAFRFQRSLWLFLLSACLLSFNTFSLQRDNRQFFSFDLHSLILHGASTNPSCSDYPYNGIATVDQDYAAGGVPSMDNTNSQTTASSNTTTPAFNVSESYVSSLPPIIPCSKIQFYDWRDSIDYKERCETIQRILSTKSNFAILENSIRGGLGHKYISIQQSVTYALILGRQYKIYLPIEFWRNTVSCIQPFRSEPMKTADVREIPRDDCAMADGREYTLSSFFNSTVKVTDCRIPYGMIYTKENLIRLKQRQVIKGKETVQDLQRILYRLLLNPTPQLQAMIHSFKQKYYTKKNVFAIQIRMGGYISDIPERTEMMSLAELEQLPKAIKDAMASMNFSAADTVLFLSTDSSFAERYIQQKLGNVYQFVTNNAFHRGHTTGVPDGVTVQRALIDLFLLADSDVLFIGHGSRFGYVARIMGRAKRVIEYKATQYIMTDFNETKYPINRPLSSCSKDDDCSEDWDRCFVGLDVI